MEKASADGERVALIGVAAIALGVHAGLAPDQLREWAPLGACFIAAAVALGLAVAILATSRNDCERTAVALTVLLAALIVGYVATRVVAIPPLDPSREPADTLGIATTAVEAAGIVAALRLLRHQSTSPIPRR